METIAVFIFLAVAFYTTAELVKHFFPSWEQKNAEEERNWLHSRIDDIEDQFSSLEKHLEIETAYDFETGKAKYVSSKVDSKSE